MASKAHYAVRSITKLAHFVILNAQEVIRIQQRHLGEKKIRPQEGLIFFFQTRCKTFFFCDFSDD